MGDIVDAMYDSVKRSVRVKQIADALVDIGIGSKYQKLYIFGSQPAMLPEDFISLWEVAGECLSRSDAFAIDRIDKKKVCLFFQDRAEEYVADIVDDNLAAAICDAFEKGMNHGK